MWTLGPELKMFLSRDLFFFFSPLSPHPFFFFLAREYQEFEIPVLFPFSDSLAQHSRLSGLPLSSSFRQSYLECSLGKTYLSPTLTNSSSDQGCSPPILGVPFTSIPPAKFSNKGYILFYTDKTLGTRAALETKINFL